MDNSERVWKTAVLAGASLGLMIIALRHSQRLLQYLKKTIDPLGNRYIRIIDTAEESVNVVLALRKHCERYSVLGFDCEWITVNGKRRPVALLQLSTGEGLCALFRLCHMKQIPKQLRELLEDDEILKVGVGPQDDAKKLSSDYGLGVACTLDIRYLATLTSYKAEGLAKLAKSVLNMEMDKNWRVAVSNWEANNLSDRQLRYAADDALVAVEIFKKLCNKLEPRYFWQSHQSQLSKVYQRLEAFFDAPFVDGFLRSCAPKKTGKLLANKTKKEWKRGISTRTKVLYENCLLEAPDGELLCTIDRKKAKWYLDQNLGTEVKQDPFTVRLTFEPAGRAVGEVGRFYQIPKENQCVVCGARDAYIRKNVVPREYRKHFPEVMKSHTSHDVLLLCPNCHQVSNISDLRIRKKLAEMCDAPFTQSDTAVKTIEVPELKKLKSAAKALLYNGDQIPIERYEFLKQVVMQHYNNEREFSEVLLHEAANIDSTIENDKYCHHGAKVVHKFQTELGGLIELEKLWREHFLHIMRPRHLPELWNVNHNAERLEIRAHEGRIDKDDLIAAGLVNTTTSQNTTNA